MEVAKLMVLILRVMVDLVADADIRMYPEPEGATFRIAVDSRDRERVLGPSGRHLRAIRVLVSSMGRRCGRAYLIEVDEMPHPGPQDQSSPGSVPA